MSNIEKTDSATIKNEHIPYTLHYNKVLQSLNDLEALGMWSYLTSLPDDWVIHKSQLKEKFSIGDDKLKRILSTLSRHNLLKFTQPRNEDGTVGKSIINVLCGNEFNKSSDTPNNDKNLDNKPDESTGSVKSTPPVPTARGFTALPVNHTSGFGKLQIKDNYKETKKEKKKYADYSKNQLKDSPFAPYPSVPDGSTTSYQPPTPTLMPAPAIKEHMMKMGLWEDYENKYLKGATQ